MTRLLLLVLLLLVKGTFAQSFITKVSATTIGKNDVLQIEYVAEDVAMEQFVLPGFKNWNVVSGPNLSTSRMQSGNTVKQQMVYSVMVQPTTTGKLIVPGATALINDKPTRSNTIAIQVKNVAHIAGNAPAQSPKSSLFDQLPFEDELPSSQYLKKGEKAIDKIRNNIMIRLEVNKRTCYIGEPILATYKLCTRLRSKSKVVKQPSFNGCTVIELTGEDQEQHVEKINGQDYNVFVIRKVQLFPLAEGNLVLPETSVENKVAFYNASNLSYRDLYYGAPSIPVEEQTVTLQNKPITVEVKSLPPLATGNNMEFSGAIGKFDIAVSTGREGITTNSTNNLLVTIEGEGNLQQVKVPEIKWPKGIEVFEATEQGVDDKNSFPVKSSKTFSFPFVVEKEGNYTIPPVEFTYFDPAANRYVTKVTRGFILPVGQGKKTLLNLVNRSSDTEGFQNRLYIILAAAIIVVAICLVWINGKPKGKVKPAVAESARLPKEEEIKPETKRPDASEFLFAVRELQPENNSSTFYKQLCKNIEAYLKAKFNLLPGQLALQIEQQTQHSAELQQLKNLLDNCNIGMYTPVFTIEEAMQHRLQAIEILCKLEKGIV